MIALLELGVVNRGRKSEPLSQYQPVNGKVAIAGTVLLNQGGFMRKIVLLAAAAALAISPVVADAKAKKKTPEELERERIEQEHDNTRRAVRDSLPLFLPSWSLPIFFGMHMDEKIKGDEAGKKTKKAKSTQVQ
jgi:hypothetical protein